MEKKRLTVHGNEVTDGRFAWVTPEKDIELLRKGIQAGFKSLAYGNEPYGLACWRGLRASCFLKG